MVLHNSKEVLFIARSRQCKNVEVHCTSAVLLAPRMTISVDAREVFRDQAHLKFHDDLVGHVLNTRIPGRWITPCEHVRQLGRAFSS